MDDIQMNFNYLHWARDQLQEEYRAKVERIILSTSDQSSERNEAISALKFPTKKQIFALSQEVKTLTEGKSNV
jgi:ribose 1,5-bisphosphokinase PhnN